MSIQVLEQQSGTETHTFVCVWTCDILFHQCVLADCKDIYIKLENPYLHQRLWVRIENLSKSEVSWCGCRKKYMSNLNRSSRGVVRVAGRITYPQWVLGEDRSPFKSRSDIGTQKVCISRLKRGAKTGAERGVWDISKENVLVHSWKNVKGEKTGQI